MSGDADYALPNHPTVDLVTPDGKVVAIDIEIAPLIKECWRLRLETIDSCQDAGMVGATIVFPDEDAWGFLMLAAQFGTPDIRHGARYAGTNPLPGGWYLGAMVRSHQPTPTQLTLQGFNIMVGFPPARLAEITKLFASITVEEERPRSRNKRHRRR